MSDKKRFWIPVLISFAAAVMICIGLLLVTALVPQSAIRKNAQRSADYFSEHELFPYIMEGQFNTRQDNYADCILFNIIYHVGTDERDSLFTSLIKSSYYCREMQEVNDGFAEAMARTELSGGGGLNGGAERVDAEAGDNGLTGSSGAIPDEARVDYFRYWHGSMVFLRPLLVVFDIIGIRLVLGTAALFLTLTAAVVLWKKRRKSLAICYLLGMFCINCWVLACCIEYVTTFLVMGACNLWVVCSWKEEYAGSSMVDQISAGGRKFSSGQKHSEGRINSVGKKRWRSILCMMTVSGVVTCFVDFLTTETLAVTMPLFLELALHMGDKKRLDDIKGVFWRVVQCGIVWGISYALMFLLKWALSAMVLGIDAMKEALASAGERLGGTVYLGATNLDPEADFLQRIFGALFRNQGMIFPFRRQFSVLFAAILFGLVIMVLFSLIYLFFDKSQDIKSISLFVLLAAIPYARFLALSNHAYIHYFFTYRAQLVTIVIVFYLVWEYGISNLTGRKSAGTSRRR